MNIAFLITENKEKTLNKTRKNKNTENNIKKLKKLY